MWTVLRDLLVVPALLWMAPLAGGDSAGERGHGWAAAKCVDERQVVKTRQAPRTAAGDSASPLRRHASAFYP